METCQTGVNRATVTLRATDQAAGIDMLGMLWVFFIAFMPFVFNEALKKDQQRYIF